MKTNTTCSYMSKKNAPAGILCGQLVSATGKFIGQIRKTGDDEFTVYGWKGIIGKYTKSAFRSDGKEWITSNKSISLYRLA